MSTHHKIISRTDFILLYTLIFPLLIGCSQPTEFDSQLDLRTPERVVDNLTFAYHERNLERYMNSFSDQSLFLDGARELWGYDTEKLIHKKMFAMATEIDLEMRALGDHFVSGDRVQAAYVYRLNLQWADESPTTAQGEVLLEFKNEGDNWRIASFRERKNVLRKGSGAMFAAHDSVDYFPLRIGNSWTYEEQLFHGKENRTVLIEDSVMINDNLFYQAADQGYFFIVSGSFARQDSLHQLRLFVEDDSTELVIFSFAAEIGDTLFFTPPNASERVAVELINRKDSLTVPAGTFSDILEFQVSDFNSGSVYASEFAANIGLIRWHGTNSISALKSALVNGKKYPIITGIKNVYASWTQIKSGFR